MLNLAEIQGRPEFVPVAWSNGIGVNSAAVACLLAEWGVKVDLCLFADTGGEWPETIQYIPVMNEFLEKHGMPPVRVVKKKSKYESLYANCLGTDTLPSKAYGGSSCSAKWKISPQDVFCNHWQAARHCWKQGHKVIKIIGYDYGDRDHDRYAASVNKVDGKYVYWCPLREAKLDREACKAVIRNAGLPVPRKSSCFFCPAAKMPEVRELARTHPDMLEDAVTLEVNAAQGKHGLSSTRGLGRGWSWLERMAEVSPGFAARHEDELELYAGHRARRKDV